MAKKLSDTANVILTSAAGRDDRRILPLPTLKAPAVAVTKIIIKAMIADGLVEAIPAGPDDERWDSSDTTLVFTTAGLAAIGIADETVVSADKRPSRGKKAGRAAKAAKKVARRVRASPSRTS